jgi:hypothetical protein
MTRLLETGKNPCFGAALRGRAAALLLASASVTSVARAQTSKTFIDYLKPTPSTCSPLSSASWGAAGVLPRDPRMYQKIFGYEGSSTYTQSYKMERLAGAGVVELHWLSA